MQNYGRLTFAMATLLAMTGTARMRAQTNDESRLAIGIAAGWIGPQQMWDVPNQPVFSSIEVGDPTIYHLHRSVQSDITMSGSATYFGSPHIGITGEFTYLGLGSDDGCMIVHDDGDEFLEEACNALRGNQRPASATTIEGGIVLRPLSRTVLQPYFKGMVGLSFTPDNLLEMVSTPGVIIDTTGVSEDNLTVYSDNTWKAVRPNWTVGFGVSTAPSSGYQIHAEFRETWLSLAVVTGPTTAQGYEPPHRSVIKMFPSLLVGFDVVLERRRGRRY